jgi:peptidoglycan/xylan/chitin deacetylase (PgdA/CDA1 family)
MADSEPYSADASLRAKFRRRAVRLLSRKAARPQSDRPMVSFSFDDIPASAADLGARILAENGVKATFYVAAGLAARQGPMGRYAGACDLVALARAGHELGCHTYTHLDCGQAPAGAIIADLDRNRVALTNWGVAAPTTFAYPYGDVSLAAKRVLKDRFTLARAIHPGLIQAGADLNQAPSIGIEGPGAEARGHLWLRRAARRKAWVIFNSHDVSERPTRWGCTPEALDGLIKAALGAGMEIVTIAEGVRRLG